MRPLAAAGSWPLVDVEEGKWLRLSIFPREAGSSQRQSSCGSISRGRPTYLPVSKRLLVSNHVQGKAPYMKKGGHTTEANFIESENLRLLQLHGNDVIKGEGGLKTFLPCHG